MKKYDVIIIGGGPAGMFSAINIKNKKVLILEKNDIVGRKLLMAGAGRCNITHSGKIKDFLDHYGKNYKFLKTALNKFKNEDSINFFKKNNLDIIEDKNGKIFPITEKSKDVKKLLLELCEGNGVRINYTETVLKINKKEEIFLIETKKGNYECEYLIISTGGKSYPTSGSTGDGYKFAKKLGHKIIECKPALTPVFIKDYELAEISGVSLQKRIVSLYRDNKKIAEHIGDIGFTHTGLTGPGILDFSRNIENEDLLKINLINESENDFRDIFIRETKENGKMLLGTLIKKYEIPKSLIRMILGKLKIDSELKLANIDKKDRNKIIENFCEHQFLVDEIGDYSIAMVTKGGIDLKEVSSKTMESKLVDKLFFAGEILDIDGDTGGYNIQAAFSMAFLISLEINSKI